MAAPVVIARIPDALSLFGKDATEPTKTIPASSFITSTDGSLLVTVTSEAVDVYKGESFEKVTSLAEAGVILTALSPKAGYLVTVTRPQKDENGQPGRNLKVWEISSGTCVLSVPQKQVSKDHWPALHWGGDDSCVAHIVTNTAHVYKQTDNFANYSKVKVAGVAGLAISPLTVADASALPEGAAGGPTNVLCAFVPEVKGSPAFAGLYSFEGAMPGNTLEPMPIVKKAFFRTSGAKIHWNSIGSAVLVMAYTDVDVTNQSYYGESKLHFLPANPAKADLCCTVELKDGPVHDVQWSPAGDYFAVVAGLMPAKVMLFDANCKPLYDLGSGPYNIVRWNPFGRFLAVAGFGNLPGDILFYDKKSSGTCRLMGTVRSPAVDCHWSPDGRHLLTATVAPRLRVDNNLKVLTYYGKQVSTVQFPCLLEAKWIPAAPGKYEDRPQSPERLAASENAAGGGVGGTRPAGYTPPHLRGGGAGAGTGGAARPQFSLGFDPNDKPGRVSTLSSRPNGGKPIPPGSEFLASTGKATSKNAKKRQNKKKADGGDDGDDDGAVEAGGAAQAAATSLSQLSVADASAQQQPAEVEGGGGLDASAKRIRNLQKKLRDIEKLKERQAKGEKLEPEQVAKLSGEAALVAEIKELGA